MGEKNGRFQIAAENDQKWTVCGPEVKICLSVLRFKKKKNYSSVLGKSWLLLLHRFLEIIIKVYKHDTYFGGNEFITWHMRTWLNVHVAVKETWPSADIRGCRFHLGQSWFRKIQALGLTKLNRNKSDGGSFLGSFFKPDDMEDFFFEDLMSFEPPNNDKVWEFCEYVHDTYICCTAQFPPSMWAYATNVHYTTNWEGGGV